MCSRESRKHYARVLPRTWICERLWILDRPGVWSPTSIGAAPIAIAQIQISFLRECHAIMACALCVCDYRAWFSREEIDFGIKIKRGNDFSGWISRGAMINVAVCEIREHNARLSLSWAAILVWAKGFGQPSRFESGLGSMFWLGIEVWIGVLVWLGIGQLMFWLDFPFGWLGSTSRGTARRSAKFRTARGPRALVASIQHGLLTLLQSFSVIGHSVN